MSEKRALSREELQAVYRAGEAAMIGLVEGLLDRIERLEGQVGKNSGNSSQPPGSDGLKRSKKRSLRRASGQASGGQAGHEGHTLKAVVVPDAVVVHAVTNCGCCAAPLSATPVSRVEKRQVFDLPAVRLEVTEHQAERKTCPACGLESVGVFPASVTHAVQYGPRFRAQLVSLHSGQFIPLARVVELVTGQYGQPIAEATILSAVAEAAQAVGPVLEALTTYLADTPEAVHCDETGARVDGTLHWIHSAGTTQATVYRLHPKRGTLGIDAPGILNRRRGWSVHDGWKPYFTYDTRHALCNAHHLRELTFIAEHYQHRWAADMRHWLCHIKHAVDRARADGRSALSDEQVYWLTQRYQAILDQANTEVGLDPPAPATTRRRPKQSPSANLLRRLRDGQAAVLAFMHDFTVPFDNNLAERDVRMVKVQQKISGGFRSQAGAQAFCAVRSYLSTARKNGVSALCALEHVFAGTPYFPPCVNQPE